MKVSINILEAELTRDGILIKKLGIFDYVSGEQLRIASINNDLLNLIKSINIDADKYMAVKDMISKNDGFKLLIDKFDLKEK